jgi:hypothetical protein
MRIIFDFFGHYRVLNQHKVTTLAPSTLVSFYGLRDRFTEDLSPPTYKSLKNDIFKFFKYGKNMMSFSKNKYESMLK